MVDTKARVELVELDIFSPSDNKDLLNATKHFTCVPLEKGLLCTEDSTAVTGFQVMGLKTFSFKSLEAENVIGSCISTDNNMICTYDALSTEKDLFQNAIGSLNTVVMNEIVKSKIDSTLSQLARDEAEKSTAGARGRGVWCGPQGYQTVLRVNDIA